MSHGSTTAHPRRGAAKYTRCCLESQSSPAACSRVGQGAGATGEHGGKGRRQEGRMEGAESSVTISNFCVVVCVPVRFGDVPEGEQFK